MKVSKYLKLIFEASNKVSTLRYKRNDMKVSKYLKLMLSLANL
jgi:hypothetical protein